MEDKMTRNPYFIPLNRKTLQTFGAGGAGAGGGGGAGTAGGGGGQGGTQGGGGGAGTAGGGGGQGGTQGGGGSAENQPYATFQDAATFNSRMDREARSRLEAIAKEAGFDTVEAFQAAAKTAKEAADKQKTEAEKEKNRADKAEQEKATALETAKNIAVNAEIKVLAIQAGFIDPADAVALVDRSNINVDDKGTVTGAKEAVEALAKAKPHLIGQGGGKPGGSPGSAGNGGRQDGSGETEIDQARKLAEERNKGLQAQTGAYDPWAKK